MSESVSQRWADVFAMAKSDDNDEFNRVMHKYAESHNGVLLVSFEVFGTALGIIDVLLTAVAEHLGMEEDELESFILLEKFKYELFGDD